MDKIIDGKYQASLLRERLAKSVCVLKDRFGVIPGLSMMLAGNDPASEIYVKNKLKAAEEVGINARLISLPANIEGKEILEIIDKLNVDDAVNGIIVQLPLPPNLNRALIIEQISPSKDIDGFSSTNLGKLFAGIFDGMLISCTALACMHLIHLVVRDLRGLNVAIIGATNIVGKPLGHLLLREKCTITFLHELSRDIAGCCARADILISATGRPLLVKEHFVKEGAIVIDVGIAKIMLESGQKIVGDVDFDSILPKISHITPVPGGVGPLTVAYLLKNTIQALCFAKGISVEEIGLPTNIVNGLI